MISDLDIYRSAKQLIDRYGDDAAFQAGVQAEEFLANKQLDAHAVWKRIIQAIKDLSSGPPTGTTH